MSMPRCAAAAVLLVSLLPGCSAALPPADGGNAAGTPTSAAATPSGGPMTEPNIPSPTPGRPSSARPSPGTGTSPGETRLTGQVELIDIEGGCLVLRVGSQAYELLGVDRNQVHPGTTITVRGRIRTDVVTICQVGPVIEVVEVLPG